MNLLYTYGDEFEYLDGTPYTGWYHESNGGYFTGMYAELGGYILVSKAEKNSLKTISLNDGIITPTDEKERFKSIKIKSIYPTVSEDDYAVGYITRYFAKNKLNKHTAIFEIDLEEYTNIITADDLPYIVYDAIELSWMISDLGGNVDVSSVNASTIKSLESRFSGISKYFTNLKEFSVL